MVVVKFVFSIVLCAQNSISNISELKEISGKCQTKASAE